MRLAFGQVVLVSVAVALAGLVLLAGCDVDPGRPHANIPPVTYLSVSADSSAIDTTNYRQILHWWGSDPDGEVVAYVYHWTGAWRAPADSARWSQDTTWVRTTSTIDTFVVPTGGVFSTSTFTVRAIDNTGAVDLPGRSQLFKLGNSLPEVHWRTSPPLPTVSLPAITFAWGANDPDGYRTVAFYRVWLEGESPSAARIVRGDSVLTLVPDDFAHYGENTVHVQGVDEALGESNVISHTWSVEQPTGRVLLVDAVRNVFDADLAADEFDAFYRAQLDTAFGAGNYYVLDLEQRGFRTAAEVGPTMSLFPVVLWYTSSYNGTSSATGSIAASQLANAAGGIRQYVEDYGGGILITSMSAIGSSGGINEAIARDVFGVEHVYTDSLDSSELVLRNGAVLHPTTATDWADSLKARTSFGGTYTSARIRYGVDFFVPAATAVPLYFVPPHVLDSRNRISQDVEYYAGVLKEQPSGGQAILLTFPMARADGPLVDGSRNAGPQLREQLHHLDRAPAIPRRIR